LEMYKEKKDKENEMKILAELEALKAAKKKQ
jgi:hypothetical protein